MLYLFEDLGLLPNDKIEELNQLADNTIKLTLGMIRYLRRE